MSKIIDKKLKAPAKPPRPPRRANLKLSSLNPLSKLTPGQAELVEEWLFTNNYSYLEVSRRCLAQFNLTVGKCGLGKYYRRIQQRRNLDKVIDSVAARDGDGGKTPEEFYEELLRLVGQMALDLTKKRKDSVDHSTIRDYIRLLSAARREMLQNRRFSFEREKWEYEVTEVCMKILPELKVISTKPAVPYQEKIRLIRMRLFGSAPERIAPLPENPPPVIETPALMPPPSSEEKPT